MIAAPIAMLLAVALQPPSPPLPVTVRPSPLVERTLPVERRADGESYVRADRLAEALGGSATAIPGASDRLRLRAAGATFDLAPGFAFVRVGDEVIPMADAPERDGTRVWIPLQFVSDVLPRVGRGVLFDTERRELRVFATAAAAPRPSRPTLAPRPAPEPAPVEPVETPRASPAAPPRLDRPAKGAHVVVVDAGHGGVDSGMQGPLGGGQQHAEKDITLGIARQLRQSLASRGMSVVMTRTRDTLVALADRGRIANQARGELFVSIHVNAANPAWRDAAAARGFETYFLADAKSEDARRVAARENESVRFEAASTAGREDPLDFIISDMAQNEHLRESSRFATLVQRRLIGVHPGPSRGVKQAGFKVLVTASMPAVLVEVGYGTNAGDAAYIASPAGQHAIAEAIAAAAVEYLARAERAGADGDAGGTP